MPNRKRRIASTLGLLATGIGLALPGGSGAQTPTPFDLVLDPLPDISGSPPPGVEAVFEVTFDHHGLELAPEEVRIDLPAPDGTIIATKRAFQPIDGFDPAGIPLKGPDELRYVWRGRSGDWDVAVAVAFGASSGTIVAPANHYRVSRPVSVPPKLLLMGQSPVDMEPPFEIAPTVDLGPPAAPANELAVDLVWVHPSILNKDFPFKHHLPEMITIDILALFTEQARLDVGGDPTDVNDIADLLPILDESYALVNHALENSLVNVQVRVLAMARITGFEPSGFGRADIANLRNNGPIRALRNAVGADIVSTTIRDTTDPAVNYCGYAYGQRVECWDIGGPEPGCGVGGAFNDFAYHVVAVNCGAQFLAVAHEFSHNMGGEHTIEEVEPWVPRDRASFPFSYAFITSIYSSITVRSPPTHRVLYFSNPNVFYAGFFTGVEALANNALTIESLAAVVAAFRQPKPTLIFFDGFETGDTVLWSSQAIE